MSRHTPGPWEVDEMLTINAPSTLMVAECSCAANRPLWGGTDYSTRAHQEANAQLMAASPEMLEALEETDKDLTVLLSNLADAERRDPKWDGMAKVVLGWRERNRQAIARASGDHL